jgi:hypothetical protein
MAEILVTENGDHFDVTVTDGASVSKHEIRASRDDLSNLGVSDHEARAVVEESMRFLLEREPKEAIMSSFGLGTITGFFPEYPDEIRRRMRGDFDT